MTERGEQLRERISIFAELARDLVSDLLREIDVRMVWRQLRGLDVQPSSRDRDDSLSDDAARVGVVLEGARRGRRRTGKRMPVVHSR